MKIELALICMLLGIFSYAQNKIDAKGLKQGPWVTYYEGSNQVRYSGNFKDDSPIGEFKYYYKEGAVSAITNFKKEGVAYTQMYHANGAMLAKGKYVNKEKDSTWWYFSAEDEVVSCENYKLGKLHGEKIVFYARNPAKEQIIKYEVSNYVNGLQHGDWIQYYENGTLKAKGKYVDGNLSGEVTWYYADGKLEIVGYYLHAVRNGRWRFYDRNGVEEKVVRYKNGEIDEEIVEPQSDVDSTNNH